MHLLNGLPATRTPQAQSPAQRSFGRSGKHIRLLLLGQRQPVLSTVPSLTRSQHCSVCYPRRRTRSNFRFTACPVMWRMPGGQSAGRGAATEWSRECACPSASGDFVCKPSCQGFFEHKRPMARQHTRSSSGSRRLTRSANTRRGVASSASAARSATQLLAATAAVTSSSVRAACTACTHPKDQALRFAHHTC
jgi:hypothetical protein